MSKNENIIKSLTPREAHTLCEKGAMILDIRDDYLHAFKYFKVSKVINIPISELEENLSSLNKNDEIIVADSSGIKSKDACSILSNNGFEKIYNLSGGFVEWERDGFPMEHDIKERLSGECACMLKPRQKKAKN